MTTLNLSDQWLRSSSVMPSKKKSSLKIGLRLFLMTVLRCFWNFPGIRERLMLQLMLLGSTEREYSPSALISRTRSLWFSGQYSAERRRVPSLPTDTRLSFITRSLCRTKSKGKMAGGARPKLEERGSMSTSDDLLMTLGLLSVELASSVDRELFLETVVFRILR